MIRIHPRWFLYILLFTFSAVVDTFPVPVLVSTCCLFSLKNRWVNETPFSAVTSLGGNPGIELGNVSSEGACRRSLSSSEAPVPGGCGPLPGGHRSLPGGCRCFPRAVSPFPAAARPSRGRCRVPLSRPPAARRDRPGRAPSGLLVTSARAGPPAHCGSLSASALTEDGEWGRVRPPPSAAIRTGTAALSPGGSAELGPGVRRVPEPAPAPRCAVTAARWVRAAAGRRPGFGEWQPGQGGGSAPCHRQRAPGRTGLCSASAAPSAPAGAAGLQQRQPGGVWSGMLIGRAAIGGLEQLSSAQAWGSWAWSASEEAIERGSHYINI